MSEPSAARVLIDSCVHRSVGLALADAGHDVASVADWPADPGDDAILRAAFEQRRIVVTLDKDFGELAVSAGLPHRGIIRLVSMLVATQVAACGAALARYRAELAAGAIITIEPGRVRVRPAEPH